MAEEEKKSVKKPGEELSWQKSLVLYLHDVVYLLGAIMLIFLLLFRVVAVSGTSMNATLLDGDYILLAGTLLYHEPEPGDIIVASKATFDNGAPIVKRVIATEGQTVDIDFENGTVYVDGEEISEPYIYNPTMKNGGVSFPLEVAEGCLFVMGDNRMNSRDSRYTEIGLIDCREVLGKAIFLLAPGTNDGEVVRDFGRIGVLK